jgi:hypothetical protein
MLFGLAPSSLAAQSGEAAAVRAVVDAVFDGMRAGDSTAVRTVMHPEARLMTTGTRDGKPVLESSPIDRFIASIGAPHDEPYDERISDVVIQVDDNLATAWMNYAFHVGDRLSHCGVNAFQFFKSEAGWKIIQITDTRRPAAKCAASP